ncbi:MAG: molybdopterin-dependent oxidoreductase [Actinomycetota bacterium]|nr:molybdopterin-dependent oxidoreductase [Actinomycetota bacterium]
MISAALLAGIPVVAVTGLLSYVAYEPTLGPNDLFGDAGILDFYLFSWPTSPSWLYALTQGLHVIGGIALVPIVLVKLWSAMPKLFEWPPLRSPAHALARASLALLVSSTLFEFATGILNVQIYYPWRFSFLAAHLYGGWVFIASFVLHTAVKLPTMRRSLAERRLLDELRRGLPETVPETGDSELIPAAPSAPTISRRGVLGLTGGASLGLLTLTAGQSVGGPLRDIALLAPHGRDLGSGPNDFQVNKTAAAVGIARGQVDASWRLRVIGGKRTIELSRVQLLAMAQHTYEMPIACVEGWSTTQAWSGVRLRDLAALADVERFDELYVESLQARGSFRRAALSVSQARDRRSLLALRVNGADLSLDHGYPARVIVPALPGVHCTKWVRRLEFRGTQA